MNLLQGYGGGDIAEWSRTIPTGDYWSRLEANIAGNPPATAVWWQICDLALDNGTLADFERPETCQKQDLVNSRRLVDHLVANGWCRARSRASARARRVDPVTQRQRQVQRRRRRARGLRLGTGGIRLARVMVSIRNSAFVSA